MIVEQVTSVLVDYKPSYVSRFVGRQHELGLLFKHYEAVKSGCIQVVLLNGEIGIGKTRLLDEFATCAMQDDAIVLRGAASIAEGMPPYLPFLEALGRHIHVTPLAQLREQTVMAPQMLASILPELFVRLGASQQHYFLLPEQWHLRLYEAVGAFLEAISIPGTLVLILDDLQWADIPSLDLLCYIARHHSKSKLLILGAYREGEIVCNPALDHTMIELNHLRILTKITIAPFSASEIEELTAGYLDGSINPVVSELLYTQSEGNAFFAEELMRSWIEEKAIVQREGQYVVCAQLMRTLPSSIIGALHQRFDRLSSDIIDHLRVAAIIGRTFNLDLLATLEGKKVEVIEERLLEAEHARLVRVEQVGVFTFCHAKIRESLYAEVSTLRCRRIHEEIGHILEAQYKESGAGDTYLFAELAFHSANSRNEVQRVVCSQRVAERTLQSNVIEEALSHYHTALELFNLDDRRHCDLLLRIGEAALLIGRDDEVIAAYEKAFIWLLRFGKREAAAQVAYRLGRVQWQQEALQAAQASFEYAITLLGSSNTAQMVRILLDLSALLTIFMDQSALGSRYAQWALEIARRLKNSYLEAAASEAVTRKLSIPGNEISTVEQVLKQALILAEANNDPEDAVKYCSYLGSTFYWKAEIRNSYEICMRKIAFIEQCQHPYKLRNTYLWLAVLFSSQGEWVKAEQMIEHAQLYMKHLSSPSSPAFLHQIRGFLAYQREDYLQAEREFQAVAPHQNREPIRHLLYTNLSGLVYVAMGKRKEAYACMIELEQLLTKLPEGTLSTAPILVCLALIAIALSEQGRAATLYPKLLVFRGQHYWFLVDRVLGMLSTFCGDWELAVMHFSDAEATARREGLCPELAHTLLERAKLEKACGGLESNVFEFLKSAQLLFEELNIIGMREPIEPLSQESNSFDLTPLPAHLTKSEAKILQLVTEGKSNQRIAKELGISKKTVATHLSHIFTKTTSENRAAATAFAIRHGLA